MLGIKKQQTPHSIIGANMQVGGPCHFRDGLRVDGEVLGDITAEVSTSPSLLIVSETGSVHGTVRADHVVVAGLVIGSVHACERLEMLAHARIQGDVHYKALDMQPGATIAGQLHPQLTPPPKTDLPDSVPAMSEAEEAKETPLLNDNPQPEEISDALFEVAPDEKVPPPAGQKPSVLID